jgi:hypothetical protein
MFIFLLGLLLLQCHSAEFSVFRINNTDSFRYLRNSHDQDSAKAYLAERGGAKVENHFIEDGACTLSFDPDLKLGTEKFKSFFAKLSYSGINSTPSDGDFTPGEIVIGPDPDVDSKFIDNMKLIFSTQNFAGAPNSWVVLAEDFEKFIPFKEVLSLYLDKKYIQIEMPENFQYTQDHSNYVCSLFDKGIIDQRIGTTVDPEDVVDSLIRTFCKYDDSDLSWYEKIIKLFDSTYLYTKGITGKPVWKTIRYSRTFRKNFSLCFLVPISLVIGLAVFACKMRGMR